MSNNVTYIARYRLNTSKTVKFEFDDQTVVIKEVEAKANSEEKCIILAEDVPEAPELYGMTFEGWLVNGDLKNKTNVVSAINTALENASDGIEVFAKYGRAGSSFSITVNEKTGATGKSTVVGSPITCTNSTWLVFEAVPGTGDSSELNKELETDKWVLTMKESANFSYWELDGVRIANLSEFRFLFTDTCVLTAVYSSSSSFEMSRATYDGSGLYLEAKLTGVTVGSVTGMKFKYGESVDLDSGSFVTCVVDPDSNGTYVANIDVSLGKIYYIQPVATITGESEDITGEIIQVEPESGYDSSEKACAAIVSQHDNTFVAYITSPDEIVRAGVIASTSVEANQVLDFDNAESVKMSQKAVKQNSIVYTWTSISQKKPSVRPYVVYNTTVDGKEVQHVVIGRRIPKSA